MYVVHFRTIKITFSALLSLVIVMGLPAFAGARTGAEVTEARAPRVSLLPASGPSGIPATARGTGLRGSVRASVYLGSTRVASRRVSRRGTVTAPFRVPGGIRPGSYRVVVQAGRRRASALFRVTAAPAPPPAPLAPPPVSSDGGSSGSSGSPGSSGSSPGPPAPAPPKTLVAGGDIACPPPAMPTVTECHQGGPGETPQNPGTAARVEALRPDVVAALGDNQYENGELANFNSVFAPSWGRFKSLIRPTPGNHEYDSPNAQGYFDYFNGTDAVTGPAGDRGKGYYSYPLGSWHVVVLNTNGSSGGRDQACEAVACNAASDQVRWLESDLAAQPAGSCTLAYFHHPRFSTAGGEATTSNTGVSALWEALYDHNVELVLAGHAHAYEHFAPLTPSGIPAPGRGLESFVVGTGGKSLHGKSTTATADPQPIGSDYDAFGVLDLKLGAGAWTSHFVTERGALEDPGAGTCH